ncbi:MAG: hypothetical protein D6768_15420 [Chloroflexi bacterium]|nr:MAG: hypothetical protein D6768_15420 [Chloroflexota bacterium]
MIEFKYLPLDYVDEAADVHIEGQPGTVLTRLGRSFLQELYRAMCVSKWADAIGAFDNDRLIGLGAVAVSSEQFFAEFKRKHLWRVAVPSALSVLKDPAILKNVVDGWRYTDYAQNPEREGDVIFLGISRDYMRHGLGPEMVRYLFGWCHMVGLNTATFMVDKRNRPMRWMVSQLNGLQIAREFEAYGRKMVLYRVPIAPNQADAKLPLGNPVVPAARYSKNGRGSP